MTKRIHLLFSVSASIVVIVAVVWGVVLVGSPTTTRRQRLDHQRRNDLRTIVREIDALCRDPDLNNKLKRPLPKSLEELAAQARHRRINVTDPESGQPYTYEVTGAATYKLCVTFSLERDSDESVFWNHPSGDHCFTIDALDPP